MVNLRDRIRIPDEEARSMIETGRHLTVASIRPDGRPHLVAMWYVLDDDGLIVFTTYAKSQKVKNLQRDPRVTAMLEDGVGYTEVRGLMIEGEAEVITDDPAFTARVMAGVGAKYGARIDGATHIAPAAPDPVPAGALKRCVVRIRPTRFRSWDHGRLAAAGGRVPGS